MTTSKTQLCYSMEEAAERLNLSETVLVRLSQALKVPSSAYEEVGSLPFKDDPVLTEQEILFFKEVKDRLLKGETLEALKRNPPPLNLSPGAANGPLKNTVKARHDQAAPAPKPVHGSRVSGKPNATRPGLGLTTPNAGKTNSQRNEQSTPSPGSTSLLQQQPLRQVSNQSALQDAASRSFKQYKKGGRLGLRQVFQKILTELGVSHNSGDDFEDAITKFTRDEAVANFDIPLPNFSDEHLEPRTSPRQPAQPIPPKQNLAEAGKTPSASFNPAQLKEAATSRNSGFNKKLLTQLQVPPLSSPATQNPSFIAPPVFNRAMPVTAFATSGFPAVQGKGTQALWTGFTTESSQSQRNEGNTKTGHPNPDRLNDRLKLAANQLKNQALQQAKGW